ncbi:fatty acid desaturase, partial [Streptomyces sp. DSM 41534]
SVLLAIMFEWGIALQGWESQRKRAATLADKSAITRALVRKVACQAGKDYLIFPALSLRRWRRTLTANAAANLLRNVWAYVVICCGHLGEGTQKFAPDALNDESKSEWYLRQMLGTANFRAGPVLAFLSGNLCYQIEHHLFPDLPSNRYAQIAPQVRSI